MNAHSVAASFRAMLERWLAQRTDDESGEQFVPICSWCERIRTGNAHWRARSQVILPPGVLLSHGICDRCRARYFPDEAATVRTRRLDLTLTG